MRFLSSFGKSTCWGRLKCDKTDRNWEVEWTLMLSTWISMSRSRMKQKSEMNSPPTRDNGSIWCYHRLDWRYKTFILVVLRCRSQLLGTHDAMSSMHADIQSLHWTASEDRKHSHADLCVICECTRLSTSRRSAVYSANPCGSPHRSKGHDLPCQTPLADPTSCNNVSFFIFFLTNLIALPAMVRK